jgi:hypothetical protein
MLSMPSKHLPWLAADVVPNIVFTGAVQDIIGSAPGKRDQSGPEKLLVDV